MTYYQLRDQIWPYGDDWGDERQSVRDYLKKIWEENVNTVRVPDTYENVKTEAKQMLQWWWDNRYNTPGQFDFSNPSVYFGSWLLGQYRDSIRVNPINNIVPGPR